MPKKNATVLIVTTLAKRVEAEQMARAMVEAHLAACVQILPIRSVYRWKGKVEAQAELLLMAKTRRSLAAELMEWIRGQHPYELPEIVQWPISAGLPTTFAGSSTRRAPRRLRNAVRAAPDGCGGRTNGAKPKIQPAQRQ